MIYSRYCEAHDGSGNLVKFYFPHEQYDLSEEEKKNLDLLKSLIGKVTDMRPPVDCKVNVAHGAYGAYSRYDVVQHKYAGGGGGFIEVLEIRDPPEARRGIVIYEYQAGLSLFTEWETLEGALVAFEKYWGQSTGNFSKLPGFIRRTPTSPLSPWFYATGNETLIGDRVLPCGLSDDPVFRIGNYFVVQEDGDLVTLKMCVGCRFIKGKQQEYWHESKTDTAKIFRIVYFDDGSWWDEGSKKPMPRPATEGELWIGQAMSEFKTLLAGKQDGFEINFTNGNKFVGRVVSKHRKKYSVQGEYFVRVRLSGDPKIREGRVEFSPTPDFPDLLSLVMAKFAQKGKQVESMEVKSRKTATKGKKWSGVFLKPS